MIRNSQFFSALLCCSYTISIDVWLFYGISSFYFVPGVAAHVRSATAAGRAEEGIRNGGNPAAGTGASAGIKAALGQLSGQRRSR